MFIKILIFYRRRVGDGASCPGGELTVVSCPGGKSSVASCPGGETAVASCPGGELAGGELAAASCPRPTCNTYTNELSSYTYNLKI